MVGPSYEGKGRLISVEREREEKNNKKNQTESLLNFMTNQSLMNERKISLSLSLSLWLGQAKALVVGQLVMGEWLW